MQSKSPLLISVFFLFFFLTSHGQNRTADGISYQILQTGTGAAPQMGQEVKCHYVVSDANGEVLWSTRTLNSPDYIVLGEKHSPMAKVRDNCFLIMPAGSRYRFEFPKAMLDNPNAADLPGAHITYDIEVLSFAAPKPSGVKRFQEVNQQHGVQAALEEFQRIAESASENYALREADINRLGYELLQYREVEAAIVIFEINVRLFPGSFNAFDSLGDAYVVKGDKISARNCFEKALQLNPNYDDARQKLSDL